ncbi:MAG: gluconokinase [Janthinobacterium lividum]
MVLILMGVSGTGKTTLGTMLSQQTGWPFLDGDDFHPAANKAKMASGHPLTDEDRAPWLAILHEKIAGYANAGTSMIMACSALRDQYRATLRGDLPADVVQFALLEADPAVIAAHLHARQHQFMNPNLLGSQLATLEDPGDDAWHIQVDGTPQQSLAQLADHLRAAGVLPNPAS